MTTIRLGAVGYLNARPLVHGLDRETRFEVRYDIPSECARLLHAQEIDLGLVPSIEFLRGPRPYMLVPGPAVTSFGKVASVAIYTRRDPKDLRSIAMDSSSRTSVALATILLRRVFGAAPEPVSMPPDLGLVPSIEFLRGPRPYMLVPGPAVTSFGKVASVAIYTQRDPKDLRSIAMDSSSRTSVALATILLERVFGAAPEPVSMPPDLDVMLERADAALIIGDKALFLEPAEAIIKIDLGELWTSHTGLPFVYAFWTGSSDGVTPDDVERLQQARDDGVQHVEQIAAAHFPGDAGRQQAVRSYLRDNIQYYLGDQQLEGLTRFFRYAAELGLASFDGSLRLYHAAHHGAR